MTPERKQQLEALVNDSQEPPFTYVKNTDQAIEHARKNGLIA